MEQRVKSQKIVEQLKRVIPGGVNSPVRAFKGLLDTPLVADHGKGDLIVDSDGNQFIDYCMSWGALIHGHAHPEIVKESERATRKGSSFGMTTEVEKDLAESICKRVHSTEKIRFVSSGTEATMSACRLARAYTKKEQIVKFSGNYHGHADFFLVQAGSGVMGLNQTSTSDGIPDQMVKHTVCLPFNDVEGTRDYLQKNGSKIAAVILEPIAGNMGVVRGTGEFIAMLREETKKQGCLLIFDEVMTGFRVSPKGCQGLYSAQPDMTCFGKIIGGGYPAAAFGGRGEIMDLLAPQGSVYQAGTLSGNPVAMCAGLTALELTDQPGFYDELVQKMEVITDPVSEMIKEHDLDMCIQSAPGMFTLFFGVRKVSNIDDVKASDLEQFTQFFRYMFEKGILIPPSQYEAWFISSAHTMEHLVKTRDAIMQYIEEFAMSIHEMK